MAFHSHALGYAEHAIVVQNLLNVSLQQSSQRRTGFGDDAANAEIACRSAWHVGIGHYVSERTVVRHGRLYFVLVIIAAVVLAVAHRG